MGLVLVHYIHAWNSGYFIVASREVDIRMKKRKIKKRKRKYGSFFERLFTGLGFISLALIFGYLLFSPMRGREFIYDIQYSIQSMPFRNDEIINNVANLCSYSNKTLDKVDCVYDFYNNMFEYEIRNNSFSLYSPKEIIENNGGLCRDFAVAIKLTLDKMGIKNNYVHIPSHIFNVVYINEEHIIYCIVDLSADILWCV